jgi:hypothetical protein
VTKNVISFALCAWAGDERPKLASAKPASTGTAMFFMGILALSLILVDNKSFIFNPDSLSACAIPHRRSNQ